MGAKPKKNVVKILSNPEATGHPRTMWPTPRLSWAGLMRMRFQARWVGSWNWYALQKLLKNSWKSNPQWKCKLWKNQFAGKWSWQGTLSSLRHWLEWIKKKNVPQESAMPCLASEFEFIFPFHSKGALCQAVDLKCFYVSSSPRGLTEWV